MLAKLVYNWATTKLSAANKFPASIYLKILFILALKQLPRPSPNRPSVQLSWQKILSLSFFGLLKFGANRINFKATTSAHICRWLAQLKEAGCKNRAELEIWD